MKNKYADMTLEELSAAKQALDAEMKKLRDKKLASEDTDERRKLETDIIQLRFAKLDIQKEQDSRPVEPLGEGHVIGAIGIASSEKVGDLGGKPAVKKSTKEK